MLLIDAMYVHDGGGRVLLNYLIKNLELTNTNCYYLFDQRFKGEHPPIKSSNNFIYLEGSLWKRHQFYKKNKSRFSKVFCFGNLPPNIKMNASVITYYHSSLYFSDLAEFGYSERFKYLLKRFILKKFTTNCDLWLVQTDLMKKTLSEKFQIEKDKISLKPFFPPFDEHNSTFDREKNSFLFVSIGTAHKNHIRLINAFCAFFDNHKIGKLVLTVSKDFEEVYNIIEKRKTQGYPILNVGLVKRKEVKKLYLSNEYLIFPSLAESFGLGLVEAIENGCKVIGADLPYTYAVCQPSSVFNPYDEKAIELAFLNAAQKKLPSSESLISDEINSLVKLLK
jgi:glycosyltransferase involved in cell wall biosynthesis